MLSLVHTPEEATTDEVADEELNLAPFIAAAAPFLPREGCEVEREILLDTWPGGPQWVGYIDLRYPGQRIVDHKTISDFRYCKTPEELLDDTQLGAYAHWEYLQGHEGPLDIAHLYLRTRGRIKANYVAAQTTRERVEAVWERDLKTVREMAEIVRAFALKDIRRADDVTPNTESCSAYGGCFFRNQCGLGDFNMNFVSAGMLARKTRENQLAAQGVTTTETSVLYVPPNKEHTMNFEELLQQKVKNKAANPAPVLRPTPDRAPLTTNHAMPDIPTAATPLDERLKMVTTDIVPPDAPDRNALPADAPVAPEPPPKKRATKKAEAGENCGPLGKTKERVEASPKPDEPFVDEGHAVDVLWKKIEATTSVGACKMLYAEIQQLPVPDRESGIKDVWRAQMELLERIAAAPETTANTTKCGTRAEAPAPETPAPVPGVAMAFPHNAFGGFMKPQLDAGGEAPVSPPHRAGDGSTPWERGESKAFEGIDRSQEPVPGVLAGVKERTGEEARALMENAARVEPRQVPEICLYIDCFPIKGRHRDSYMLAEDFLRPIMEQVAEDHAIPDYRLIPYGGGKAALSQAIRRSLHTAPRALVVSSYASGSNEILENLIPWATDVVKH